MEYRDRAFFNRGVAYQELKQFRKAFPNSPKSKLFHTAGFNGTDIIKKAWNARQLTRINCLMCKKLVCGLSRYYCGAQYDDGELYEIEDLDEAKECEFFDNDQIRRK